MTESLFTPLNTCDVCGVRILLRAQVVVPVRVLRTAFRNWTRTHEMNPKTLQFVNVGFVHYAFDKLTGRGEGLWECTEGFSCQQLESC